MADPATFLASDAILGSEELVYSLVKKKYIFLSLYCDLIRFLNIKILRLKFCATLKINCME